MQPSAISALSCRSDGLVEFVGDARGDGGARIEERGGEAVGVADHEGDRHGLAERAAEAEHDARR